MTGEELIERVVKLTQASGDSDLARKLGMPAGYSSPQKIRRWRLGENEPDYQATIALLDLVGAIRWEALTPPGSAEGSSVEQLRAELDRTVALTRELERRLEAAEASPARRRGTR